MMDHPDLRLFLCMIAMHPNSLASLSQSGDIKVTAHRSFLSPTAPVHQLTPSEMFNKSIKRDDSLFYNFKEIDERFLAAVWIVTTV